ncbi:chromosomal replication initiator protein DnaA [Ekhidna sp.]|jgi:chromosomal replication initiator protein|uniref:chromosomal replication initiator protein DnaA n=1 Tax=Ekhidna sp. TaxID=2608089 RepID=UPI0032ED8BB2
MHDLIWKNCLEYIKERIPNQSYSTWFEPINPLKTEGNVLTIQVPSQFFYEWLEEHYVHILKEAISKEMGDDARLEYSVVVENEENKKSNPTSLKINNLADRNGSNSNGLNTAFIDDLKSENNLNPTYTFSNFIEGDCNRLGRSAGYAVAKKPGITSFNPLMIYGGVGLGKTHLVQAIGNHIKNEDPSKKIIYVASEKFTNQFIDSLKNNNVQSFISYYRGVDILILDDVQFLRDKEKTQEIFFHIFNHLHQAGKQIVMTSDCAPKDLKGLQERLVSRFKWGLTADLQQPAFETRMAIIQRKIQEDGIHIPEEVIEYIAYTVDTNIRELEGVVVSLIAHASLMRVDVDLELAKKVLKNIVKEIDSEVGIDYIQKTVSEYFHVGQDDLKAKTRKKEIVIARQVAMYFSKDYTNHSLKSIGYHFGGRDHSTVIHALQSVNDMMDTDSKFRYSVDELKKKLKMRTA